MGRKKRTEFGDSFIVNQQTYLQYIEKLTELSISMFDWQGLPESVDARYIELNLFSEGSAVYFRDEVMGDLCLKCIQNGEFDVYGNPIYRRAYSGYNNYTRDLTDENSVIIWNNLVRTNSILNVKMFARRLYLLDRIVDVNANAQKTPILLQCDEKQRLTLLNLYMNYDGNAPVIYGDKNLDLNGIKAINTGAEYVADKIFELKTKVWNEALTFLGISNVSIQKKERLVSDEVLRSQGGTIASRYSRLQERQIAAKKINAMFGTNITVDYREDYQIPDEEGEDDNNE